MSSDEEKETYTTRLKIKLTLIARHANERRKHRDKKFISTCTDAADPPHRGDLYTSLPCPLVPLFDIQIYLVIRLCARIPWPDTGAMEFSIDRRSSMEAHVGSSRAAASPSPQQPLLSVRYTRLNKSAGSETQ